MKDDKTDLINKLILSSMKIHGVPISHNIPPQISGTNESMIVLDDMQQSSNAPIIILSSDDEMIAERDYHRLLTVKDGHGYKLISGQLVRNDKVQTLVKQLANAVNVDENGGVRDESMESRSAWVNACPRKHSYSTYYERKKSIGGVLMNSQQVFKQYCIKMRLLNRKQQKNENRNVNIHDWNLTFFDKGCMVDDLFENMLKLKPKNRTRSRMEQTNLKKARKYELPNDNLSRMEIRDDIRRMKEPKLHDLLSIISDLGYDSYAPVYEQLIKEQSISSSWDVHSSMNMISTNITHFDMKWDINEYQSEHDEISYEFQPPTTQKKRRKDKERDRDREKKRKRRKKEKKRRKRERSRIRHKHSSSKHHTHHNIQIAEQTEKELSVSVMMMNESMTDNSLKRRFNRDSLSITAAAQEPLFKKQKLSIKQTLPMPNFSSIGLQNTIPMSFTAADAQRHKISRNASVSVPGPLPLPVSFAPVSVITIDDDDEDIERIPDMSINLNMTTVNTNNMNANPPKKCCICAQMFTLEVDLMLHTMIEHKKIQQQT